MSIQAKDLMTTDVVTVGPDTPANEIARLLLEHTISAAPVVDSAGAPVGMVSEGDLVGRDDSERDRRRDWWLAMLAEGERLSPDFLASLHPTQETAKDIMAAPVVTVTESTDVTEIARVLSAYRIKRVPVVREGHIVGIVSRADLLRAMVEMVSEGSTKAETKRPGLFSRTFRNIDRHFLHLNGLSHSASGAEPAIAHADIALDAADFRSLVSDYHQDQSRRQEEERHAVVTRRRGRIKDLIDHHIEDENWQAILHRAREAAQNGETSVMILRFPSQLCSDGGRAINKPDPDWPKTLRGEAAEVYLRWEHNLKPHGFHLTAQVLDFPDGVPGDIGLFLVWGE